MSINLNLGRGGLLAIFLLVASVGVTPVTGSSTSQPTQRTRVVTHPHIVTVDGQTESINSTIRISSGDTLSISPDLKPSFYYLEIYHESHRLEKLPIAGNKTYRYQIPNSASGEYIVALEKQTGKLINVTDVTVSKYSITTTVPSNPTDGIKCTLVRQCHSDDKQLKCNEGRVRDRAWRKLGVCVCKTEDTRSVCHNNNNNV